MANLNREQVIEYLQDFKTARDAVVHADSDELQHHLVAFIREIDRNPLCQEITSKLPSFDVAHWWESEVGPVKQHGHILISFDFPENKDEKLVALLQMAQALAKSDSALLSLHSFGGLFGKYNDSEAISLATSLILRPLADELTKRIRKEAALPNPALRDLVGVPLNRIPPENETSIFLSHKWADKDLVRRYFHVLKELGHQPWLDEDAMVAGDVLHRALRDGMSRSCAAVFFVTKNFEDTRWIGKEVDLAMNRKVELGNKFQVITLVFGKADAPTTLKDYVYVDVENELEGLRVILKALPIELGPLRWKEKVVTESR